MGDVELDESALCVTGSRLVPSGFVKTSLADDLVTFLNAEAKTLSELGAQVNSKGDFSVQGGEILRTDETIISGGDYPSLYHCARFGNFSYTWRNISPGDYVADLHFAEIINVNGPKGMRVFDVYIQEEKVLSELDVYSIVGANKPLQLVDTRFTVSENREVVIRFQGIRGSAAVCGICIRKIREVPGSLNASEHLLCTNCASEIEVPTAQVITRNSKDASKYKKKIEELESQIQYKTDECYEAWMSLKAANDQLDKLRMDLDINFFRADSLDRTTEKQAQQLKDVSTKYQHDRMLWAAAIKNLEEQIKVMKAEHYILSQQAHRCVDSIPELNKMIFSVQTLVTQVDELKLKYNEEMAKRKRLFNLVIENKGNIRVFCRCRPLSKDEIAAGCANVLDFDAAKDGDIGVITNVGPAKKVFKFDRVFAPKDDQVDVFADTSPLVVSVLDGYNVCIFAYGQTGTGKTFTMEGIETNRGVNYRTLEELFKVARERTDTVSYKIFVSVLEVYNEQIRDLLATSPSKKLEIRQVAEGSHHVPGIVEAEVKSVQQVWDALQAGSNARAVGSNNVNEHSSRSHCMLCIRVISKNLMNGECTKSKLWLVDLAGSERLAKTEAQGDRLKEAQNINKSLSSLGDVISALAAKNSHVPYRNSKLTHLLQDSLGGDSKTLMFVQISPSDKDLGETISSLNFATRVRGVELGPAKKQIDLSGDLQKLKQMLEKAKAESRNKDESIRKLEEVCQNLEGKLRNRDQVSQNHLDKVKELEQSKQELQRHSERQILQLSDGLKDKENKVMELENKLRQSEVNLKEQQKQVSENLILQEKVRELEMKLNEKKKQLESPILHSFYRNVACNPTDMKSILNHSSPCETMPGILKNSNLISPMNNESFLLRGVDSLQEIRRKRERQSGPGELENRPSVVIQLPVSTLQEKKAVGGLFNNEFIRSRQSDVTTKPMARLSRTRPTTTATNLSRLSSHGRFSRGQAGGALKEKEKEKAKIWAR